MTKVSIEEASRDLRALIERVRSGEDIVIVDHDEVLARIEALERRTGGVTPERQPGSMKVRLKVPQSFFDPLPDEELRRWWGETS